MMFLEQRIAKTRMKSWWVPSVESAKLDLIWAAAKPDLIGLFVLPEAPEDLFLLPWSSFGDIFSSVFPVWNYWSAPFIVTTNSFISAWLHIGNNSKEWRLLLELSKHFTSQLAKTGPYMFVLPTHTLHYLNKKECLQHLRHRKLLKINHLFI